MEHHHGHQHIPRGHFPNPLDEKLLKIIRENLVSGRGRQIYVGGFMLVWSGGKQTPCVYVYFIFFFSIVRNFGPGMGGLYVSRCVNDSMSLCLSLLQFSVLVGSHNSQVSCINFLSYVIKLLSHCLVMLFIYFNVVQLHGILLLSLIGAVLFQQHPSPLCLFWFGLLRLG